MSAPFPFYSLSHAETITRYAIIDRHINVIKWLQKHDIGEIKFMCELAIGTKRFEVLKLLLQNDGVWTEECVYDIIEKGNVDILKWLLDRGYTLNPYFCARAKQKNRHELLECAFSYGYI